MASGDRIAITGVKSIQRGETNVTGTTITTEISAVNLERAFIVINNSYDREGSAASLNVAGSKVRAKLASSTQIVLKRGHDNGSVKVSWQVIEYN